MPDLELRGYTGHRKGAWVDAGPYGIWAASFGRPFDPRGSTLPGDAVRPQSQGEIPGVVSALRALSAARGHRGLVRIGLGQSVHAAGRGCRETSPEDHDGGSGCALRDR